MSFFELVKLFIFDRKELAFQILAGPIRAEIIRREKRHSKVSHLYERLKDLRSFTLD